MALFVAFYYLAGLGVTIGYHRYFTHGSFKANRPLRIALAIAGSMALQGPVIDWVADHRRHHAFSDREGDPHSPWLFGTSPAALAKGFWHAHMGWLFDRDLTNHAALRPRPAGRQGHRPGRQAASCAGRPSTLAAPGVARRADHLVLVGRA